MHSLLSEILISMRERKVHTRKMTHDPNKKQTKEEIEQLRLEVKEIKRKNDEIVRLKAQLEQKRSIIKTTKHSKTSPETTKQVRE